MVRKRQHARRRHTKPRNELSRHDARQLALVTLALGVATPLFCGTLLVLFVYELWRFGRAAVPVALMLFGAFLCAATAFFVRWWWRSRRGNTALDRPLDRQNPTGGSYRQ